MHMLLAFATQLGGNQMPCRLLALVHSYALGYLGLQETLTPTISVTAMLVTNHAAV